MNRIKRISKFFRVFFQIILVIMPLIFVYTWLSSPQEFVLPGGVIHMTSVPDAYRNHIFHVLSGSERLMAALVSAVPVCIVLFIVYSLIKLFKLYEQGEIFSLANVRYIRNIGYAMLALQIVDPFYQLAIGYVLTVNNPPGQGYMSVTLDQGNVEGILTALVVILISWIMAEGCKLREEQQLTI